MRGPVVRIGVGVVGVILFLLGVTWILQGLNLLPGSFMTGQIIWAIYGAPVAGLGAALMWVTRRAGRG